MGLFEAGAGAGALLAALGRIAEEAGREILRHYHPGVEARLKQDRTPVTAADEAAEAIILPALRALAPEIPSVAEEATAHDGLPQIDRGRPFFLVDPLDGTREFLHGSGEFTVNIALIEKGRPVLGVVHLPALATTYAGGPAGASFAVGETRQPISARPKPSDGVIVLASRSHNEGDDLDRYLATIHVAERIAAGSSLKFCRIAEGLADLYPRFGRTMEWDTAAGHAVLAAAGGHVVTADGAPLAYGKPGFANPNFIARGRWS
jgi:3'(2'), 5'-bisphosphate nucleotidase